VQKGQAKHTFVESSENDLGIGKLCEINGELAKIEYFRSPAESAPPRKGPLSKQCAPVSGDMIIPNPLAAHKFPFSETQIGVIDR